MRDVTAFSVISGARKPFFPEPALCEVGGEPMILLGIHTRIYRNQESQFDLTILYYYQDNK